MEDLEKVYNANALITAFRKCKKNTAWKESVQRYEANLLINILHSQRKIKELDYAQAPVHEFNIRERGKPRHIKAVSVADRVVQRSVCDNLLLPKIRPLLIYDNSASLKGKGVDFARRRLYAHLEKYYRQNGTNEGYILLIDYSKYFDNIQHGELLRSLRPLLDDRAFCFIRGLVKNFEVDVSYMTDSEYANCLNTVFNSLEYDKIDKSLLTGKKFMAKSMGIGSQISQVASVYYPRRIDNLCKVVEGNKWYARYADDSYAISPSKEYLQSLLEKITAEAKEIGIAINAKKTVILPLSKFHFLKLHYSLQDNGRVKVKSTNEAFRKERKKLNKFHKKMENELMDRTDIDCSFRSFVGGVARYGNHFRITKIIGFYCKKFNYEVYKL